MLLLAKVRDRDRVFTLALNKQKRQKKPGKMYKHWFSRHWTSDGEGQ